METFEDAEAFGKRISAVRGWKQMQRPEFGEFMGVSESTVWRWDEGDIGKKRANPEGRRQFALWMLDKTGCPPELLGLSELGSAEADQIRREMADEMEALRTELLEEMEKELDARASGQRPPKPAEED
jgi:transcriptional regulator with XRE-family HTH domain